MNILSHLQERFLSPLSHLAQNPAQYLGMIRTSQDPKFGDFQANFAMSLAKEAGSNPRELAARIVAEVDLSDLCDSVEVAGPGFINLRLKPEWLVEQINRVVTDERMGVTACAAPQTIVVDFSSPNVAKPMHVGHLRSTVIGDALAKILRFVGHKVITDNHVGDWGTQFGMIIYGYKHFLDRAAYESDPVPELARLYRLVNQLSDYHAAQGSITQHHANVLGVTEQVQEAEATATACTDKQLVKELRKAADKLKATLAALREETESLEKKISVVETHPILRQLAAEHVTIARAARDETAKLHANDATNLALWQQFVPACLKALDKVYERLGITFDLTLGESYFQPQLESVVTRLRASGLATESDGAICVFMEGFKAPFIIRKADGAFTYATTDIATIEYRRNQLQADVVLYVVDNRQSEHFEMLLATAKQLGYGNTDLRHISFGTVLGPDRRPYKTRAGDTVGLESLLDEAVREARAIVEQNADQGQDIDEAERAGVAEIVGLGGIKYADLHHNRESDYIFDWAKMLAKTGDTATYLQYAYARTRGILRKAETTSAALCQVGGQIRFTSPAERGLALNVLTFEQALSNVTSDYRPNVLTQYLFDLAKSLSTFYEECDVVKEPDPGIRLSRLQLVDLAGRVLKQGLTLLGIETVEKM